MRRSIWMMLGAIFVAVALGLAMGCGSDDDADAEAAGEVEERPTIVVTTPMLGSVVSEIVGDAAEVHVVMPNGVDPHDYSPSAQEIARLQNADLVVENGLQLEEGMLGPLDRARDAGVPFFTATDHIDLREGGTHSHDHDHGADAAHRDDEHGHSHDDEHGHSHDDEHGHSHDDEHGHSHDDEHGHSHDDEHGHGADEGHSHGDEHGHSHGGMDPHIWLDPIAMRDIANAVAPVLQDELGLDVAEGSATVASRMEDLDERVRETLEVVPADQRRFVTGHDSMGYFADRYDFEVSGILVPSFSSQAQASAANLAELSRSIDEEGITVIFSETGTPPGVAEAIGRQTGADVVEIDTHTLPADGSYETFVMDLATTMADAYGTAS